MKNNLLILPVFLLLLLTGCRDQPEPVNAVGENRPIQLFPDYTGLTLPPNIAPLNFEIKAQGEHYHVRIEGHATNETITISQASPQIKIPEKKWRQLLQNNIDRDITLTIHIRQGNQWRQYPPIRHHVATEPIDPFLYYRDIVPTNGLWNKMAMHQRNLETFRETELFNNYRIEHDCMNCHTFNRNNPDQYLFHVRGNHGGTVIHTDGQLRKISFPTPHVISAGAYADWHPDGRIIAFAVNNIKQNYYLSGYGDKMKEVFDLASDIVLYDTRLNDVINYPQIASPMRENLPAWSADGKHLYFVTAPPYVAGAPNESNLYSLMQAPFDPLTNQLGEPELLLSADTLQGSLSFPAASPDGRFLLFCRADFGYFPVNNKSADIYLLNLGTQEILKPDINSDQSESYITWSTDSRWFIFSSRRMDGMTSKPYICHIDTAGRISKPFVLPQKDPDYYLTDHRNFSRPELISSPVETPFRDLQKVIFNPPDEASFTQKLTRQ